MNSKLIPTGSEKTPISIIILTFNEEQNIERCLESVYGWAAEIFVVDSGSTDRTIEIAKKYVPDSHIIFHEFVNYARQRNWTLENLHFSFEWVLNMDAGEAVSSDLAHSLARLFEADDHLVDGYLINRRAIFLGRWIRWGGIYPTYHLRLFRRSKGRCEDREYDQHFVVDGPVAKLNGDLIDDVTSDLSTWTLSHERWAGSEAREYLIKLKRQQVPSSFWGSAIERRRWLRQKIYGSIPLFFRPFIYFFVRYFLLLGFLDGKQGLIFHFLHACWYRFYVDAKIWEMQHSALTKEVESNHVR